MMLAILMALGGDARASELDLGLGLRSPGGLRYVVTQQGSAFGGVQGVARYRLGWLTVEGDLFFHPDADRYTDFDATLVYIASLGSADVDFQAPLYNEVASLQGLVSLGLPLDPEARWAGGPTLIGGVWGGVIQKGFLMHDANAADEVTLQLAERQLQLGPVAGLGVEGWYGGRVGLRLSWLARLARQEQPQYDPNIPVAGYTLVNQRAFTLDLMVHL